MCYHIGIISFTVPNGYNATRLKSANVRVKYVTKEIHGMGVCSVPSISGNTVRLTIKKDVSVN